MTGKFKEIKHHVNKPTEYYECSLLRRDAGSVVLSYVSDRKFASTRLGITFPPGCTTVAFYWEARPYVFWGIYSPEKDLLGYLIHICRDVAIVDNSVSYLDMLLDIWFYPDGHHAILDADEVEECFRSGRLTQDDKEFIQRSKEVAIEDFAANSESLKAISDKLDISGACK